MSHMNLAHDIKNIRERRTALEQDIKLLIAVFECETTVRVESIDISSGSEYTASGYIKQLRIVASIT